MEAPVPSPQTTLLILLGASKWPLFAEFQNSEAFANAAREVEAYFLDPKRFGLSPENVLDVFNSNHSPDEQDAQIGQFLERRLAAMKATGLAARDLLVYFVGHGGFVGRDSDFYLAIRRTRMENPRASGIPMQSLADTLTEKARYLRRIIILDCCFAAAAFSAFQAGPAQVAIEKTIDAFEVKRRGGGFPTKGTTLLCSSSQKSPSLLLPDGSSTMFTKALLDALAEGLPPQRDRLSLREVKDVAAALLSETRNAPRPVVLSPDQSEGDVADIPFFPNPRAQEERAHLAEEERRHLAEEAERTRRMEEERQRRVEEEQAPTTVPSAEIVTSSPAPLWAKRPSPATHLPTDGRAASQAPLPVAQRKKPLPSIPSTPGSLPMRVRLPGRAIILALLVLVVVGSGGFLVAGYFTGHLLLEATPTLAPSAYDQFVMKNGIQFGFDAAHSHFNPYERILSPVTVPHLKQAWTAQTRGPIPSSPAVANGVVYVGSQDFHLYAFNATTGATLWTAQTGNYINSSPTVANGIVYIGSNDDKLYAFNATTGATLWAAQTGNYINSSPTVANGIVYIGSNDGKLYAFNAAGCGGQDVCQPLWTAQTGNYMGSSSPAVANGVVYIGSNNHKLYAFEAAGCGVQDICQPLWTAQTGDVINSSPAVGNGVVYIGSTDDKLYAFNATTGATLWTARTGFSIDYSSPAVANGVVYVGSTDDKLYAFNATTGATLWTARTGFSIDASSPTVANGVVYVGSQDFHLYAFNATTGATLWTAQKTGNVINSSPAVANGVVYIGSDDHKLYAFHLPGTAS